MARVRFPVRELPFLPLLQDSCILSSTRDLFLFPWHRGVDRGETDSVLKQMSLQRLAQPEMVARNLGKFFFRPPDT